jgi:hypothetical protein
MKSAVYPMNPYYSEYYKMISERYLDGYAGMASQSMMFDTVLLCRYCSASNDVIEKVCFSYSEASREMRFYLQSGICAWIKYE